MRGVGLVRSLVCIHQVIGWMVVCGISPEPPRCVIPEGEFDGIIVDSNTRQPFYGDRCSVSNATVQVTRKQCMPYFCCEEPCICGGENVKDAYTTCVNSTRPKEMLCYVPHVSTEQTLYGCCQGSSEDQFHVCSKAVNCATNNGGCDQLCLHNDQTDKDYCDCYPGYKRQLTDSQGTTLCRGNGTIPTLTPLVAATDLSTSSLTPSVTPAAQVFVTRDFPVPYIIAIVVGIILLLLLLLLLLFLALCYRRRAKKVAIACTRSSKAVVCVTIDEKKPVKDFWLKVDDDDEKVKGETTVRGTDTHRVVENDYSEDPVGMVAVKASANDSEMEDHHGYDGGYEELPQEYDDNEAKYAEIPANYNAGE